MKSAKIFFLFFLLLLAFVWGCGKVVDSNDGTVTGTLLAADGTTAIGGATVSSSPIGSAGISAKGTSTTDLNGAFSVSAPAGTTTIYAQKGSFSKTISVPAVVTGTTTDVGNQLISPTDESSTIPDIAVIKGSFDSIEDIITSLGYSYTEISPSDLLTASYINTFEAIFIDCGSSNYATYYNNETVKTNLVSYINAGGSLYVSDWAYPYVEAAFPNYIDFFGDDADPEAAKIGNVQSIEATVVDSNLINNVLGKSTVSIIYNLPAWVVINSTGSGTSTLIKGDISTTDSSKTNSPLAVSFTDGSGKVIYTTFHNEAQITTDMQKILKDFILSL